MIAVCHMLGALILAYISDVDPMKAPAGSSGLYSILANRFHYRNKFI